MSNNTPIRRVTIIGTGVIGASWTALFLAKGLDVVATDIAPDADTSLKRFVKAAWPALERLGLAPGASLVIEIAPHQSESASALATAAGFGDVIVRDDLLGRPRVLVARAATLR